MCYIGREINFSVCIYKKSMAMCDVRVHLCQSFSMYIWACRVGVVQYCWYIWDPPYPSIAQKNYLHANVCGTMSEYVFA